MCIYALKAAEELTYIDDAVKEGEKTGSITVLPGGYHKVNVTVLDKHVSDPIIVSDWII